MKWEPRWPEEQIGAGRHRDRYAKEKYFASVAATTALPEDDVGASAAAKKGQRGLENAEKMVQRTLMNPGKVSRVRTLSDKPMHITDRLNELMLSYHRETRRCLRGKAYLAATVMQVAAFEAAVQMMSFLYPLEIKRTAVYAHKRFRGKRNRALEFTLNQLIDIADELGWFPAKRFTWAGRRTTIAGFAHEIRKVRNCVHLGVWSRDRSDTVRFTKGEATAGSH